jgi:AcrR family transcriptional regulator
MFSPRQIEILDELSGIVLVEGFCNLTVADLADRLRCSRRTLYTLAPTRDDLILGVVERLFERWTEHADAQAAAAGGGLASVVAYLDAGVQACTAHLVFFDDVEEIASTSAVHRQFRTDRLDRLARLISEGVAEGSVRSRDEAVTAELLDAMAERIRALCHDERPSLDAGRATVVLRDLVECWLGEPAAATSAITVSSRR